MPPLWQIEFIAPSHGDVFAEMVYGAVDGTALSLHCDDDKEGWQVMVMTPSEPRHERVRLALDEACNIIGSRVDDFDVVMLAETDWLAENRKSFPPLDIGSFWIYGNYVTGPIPDGKIGLKLDAGAAFGSGTHGTTEGCITMLERHCPAIRPIKIADIGCGSGILAMVAAKLCPNDASIIAVDNDPMAIDVAAENFNQNDVGWIRAGLSDGYQSELVQKHAPYHVITANILPKPLIEMAKDGAACLEAGGVMILSGLMEMHRQDVLPAYQALGLKLLDSVVIEGWVTLAMTNRGRNG